MNITRNAICSFPFTRLRINANGECGFCCFQDIKVIGNLFETNVEDIWKGEAANEIREEILKGRLHNKCSIPSCPLFHIQNKKILKFKQYEHPEILEIYLPNTHCNIGGTNPTPSTACIMCVRSHGSLILDKDRTIEICEHLRPFAKSANLIHIQGWAEPFWKDKIFETIEVLEANVNETTISSTTNATVWDSNNRIERWLEYPKTLIGVSIDAGTPETYKKIRRIDAYPKVIESLTKFCSLKKPGQGIRIQNNINLLNVHEVEEMVKVAAMAGVDSIDFNPTHPSQQLIGMTVSEKNVDIFKKAEETIIKTANKLKVKATFTQKLTLGITLELVQLKLI